MMSFFDRYWRIGLVVWILLLAAIVAASEGLQLRRWAWDYSQGAHFQGDISNAFFWGSYTREHGLLAVYDDNLADNADTPVGGRPIAGERKIDYTPLRLTAAWLWYRWAHARYPWADVWQDNYEFTQPLLTANTIAEGSSAISVFFIIWLWRRRSARLTADSPPWHRALCGVIPGLFGAAILWFNPGVVWDGHCWPQWDVWPVPFFLAAVLLASVDFWFTAGLCLAIGGSLKGQILLGAPILLIWPIFRGHFVAALRLLSGFALLTMLIALPWMRCSPAAYRWLAGCGVVLVCAAGLLFYWKKAAIGLPILGVLAAAAIFAVMPLYHASTAWYTLGFKYGTEKYGFMVVGNGAYNIPRMLQVYFQWPTQTNEDVQVPYTNLHMQFTMLTRTVYAIMLALCGVGAALQDRRRDVRFLAAIVAPWLLFFMILTQMHGRYDVWAAAICPLLAGVEFGMAFLAIIVGCVCCMGIMHNQMLFSSDWWPQALELFGRLDPGPGFLLLLITLIVLYVALLPRRRYSVPGPVPAPVAPPLPAPPAGSGRIAEPV
jgi:hypothetical protein